MDLQGLNRWFHDNAKRINTDKQGAYWQLRRDGNRLVFSNVHVGEVQESWELLEYYVNDQLQQGAKMLKVYYRNEPKARAEVEYMIKTPGYGSPAQPQGQNAIGGLGYGSGAIGDLYEQRIQEKERALIDRYEAKIEAITQQHANEKRMEELEDHLNAIREEKKTSFDRLMEALEDRPEITDKVVGALAPAIQGVLTSFVPARAQVAVQGPVATANVPPAQQPNEAEEAGPKGQDTPEQPPALDFNASSQALINLTQAGFPAGGDDLLRLADCVQVLKALGYDDPVGTFESLTKYARNNPETARSILSNLEN